MYIENDPNLCAKFSLITKKYIEMSCILFTLVFCAISSLYLYMTSVSIATNVSWIIITIIFIIAIPPVYRKYRFIKTLNTAKQVLKQADKFLENEHNKKKEEFFK